jgi:hypothetical protein
MDTWENLSSEVDSAVDLLRSLRYRVNVLEQDNARLRAELEALQGATSQSLTSDDVRRWVDAVKATDPTEFNLLRVGDWNWDNEGGFPTGGGLRALIMDLTAYPNDSYFSRLGWDAEQRRREQRRGTYEAKPYPPRFKNSLTVASVLEQRGETGSAHLLTQLTRELRDGTKAKCVIEICFLLFGQDAVRMVTAEPAEVLKRISREVARASGPASEAAFKRFADLFGQVGGHGEKRKAAYITLDVDSNASPEDIKAAYRRKALEHHPDQGGDVQKFHQVKEAFDLLTA